MRRDILRAKPGSIGRCCPGHDTFPSETYNNRRSKRARSRDIKKEHRVARRILNKVDVNLSIPYID